MKNIIFKLSNLEYHTPSFDDYFFRCHVNSIPLELYSTTFLTQTDCIHYIKSLFNSTSTTFKVIYYFQVIRQNKTYFSKRIHTFYSFSSVFKFVSDIYAKSKSNTTFSFLIYPSSPDCLICNPYFRV